MSDIKIAKSIIYFSLLFFLIGTLFDITVTTTAYKMKPISFGKYEANTELVDFFYNGKIPLGFIVLNMIMGIIPILSLKFFIESEREKKKQFLNKRKVRIICLLIGAGITIFFGYLHIHDALGWWLFYV